MEVKLLFNFEAPGTTIIKVLNFVVDMVKLLKFNAWYNDAC